MKKIIFILLTLIIFINVTKAEILEEENNWQEEPLYGDNVETEYRYRFYREYDYGEYVRIGQTSEYLYEDKQNIMYGDYSGYMEECIEKEGYVIEEGTQYEYQELLPIQYVKIVNTSDEILKINSMEINNLDTIVNYEFYLGIDGVKKDLTIKPNGYIIFRMSYNVPLRNFALNLEVENENITYDIVFSNGRYFEDYKLVAKVSGSSNRLMYKHDDTFYLYDNYTPIYTSYNIKVDSFVKVISSKNVCREREKMTYRYNIEKEYYDDNYYASVDDLIKLDEKEKQEFKEDTKDYKIFYRYTINNSSEDDNANNNTDNKEESSKEDTDISDKESYDELEKEEIDNNKEETTKEEDSSIIDDGNTNNNDSNFDNNNNSDNNNDNNISDKDNETLPNEISKEEINDKDFEETTKEEDDIIIDDNNNIGNSTSSNDIDNTNKETIINSNNNITNETHNKNNITTNNDSITNKKNNLEENIKLVKTGINNSLNYNYLILYVLTLLLIALLLIKKIKKMSNKNNI